MIAYDNTPCTCGKHPIACYCRTRPTCDECNWRLPDCGCDRIREAKACMAQGLWCMARDYQTDATLETDPPPPLPESTPPITPEVACTAAFINSQTDPVVKLALQKWAVRVLKYNVNKHFEPGVAHAHIAGRRYLVRNRHECEALEAWAHLLGLSFADAEVLCNAQRVVVAAENKTNPRGFWSGLGHTLRAVVDDDGLICGLICFS